jgi:2-polyprenyl-3-methyl-5-hydroxy-6-metoxy-1,4-benzoquinol methylase
MALPPACRLCAAGPEHQEVTTRHVYGAATATAGTGGPRATGGHAFFRCGRCEVYYMYPPIAERDEQRLYAQEFEKFMAGRSGQPWQEPAAHVKSNADQVARRMRYLRPRLPTAPASVCEIGCSSGFMLSPLREAGYEVFGVEPSRVFGDFLRQQRVAFVSDVDELFDQARPRRQFDVVMHFFVLEHMRDPAAFITRTLALVRPGGTMIMEIPNAADPLVTVYDMPAFERFYWSLAHHWYFTEPALRYVLDRIGQPYELLVDQRYDLSNHLVWAMTGRPGGMERFADVFGPELDALYKQRWIDRRQCDTVIAVLRRDQ